MIVPLRDPSAGADRQLPRSITRPMRRFWLVFAQTATIWLAVLFVVSPLRVWREIAERRRVQA